MLLVLGCVTFHCPFATHAKLALKASQVRSWTGNRNMFFDMNLWRRCFTLTMEMYNRVVSSFWGGRTIIYKIMLRTFFGFFIHFQLINRERDRSWFLFLFHCRCFSSFFFFEKRLFCFFWEWFPLFLFWSHGNPLLKAYNLVILFARTREQQTKRFVEFFFFWKLRKNLFLLMTVKEK